MFADDNDPAGITAQVPAPEYVDCDECNAQMLATAMVCPSCGHDYSAPALTDTERWIAGLQKATGVGPLHSVEAAVQPIARAAPKKPSKPRKQPSHVRRYAMRSKLPPSAFHVGASSLIERYTPEGQPVFRPVSPWMWRVYQEAARRVRLEHVRLEGGGVTRTTYELLSQLVGEIHHGPVSSRDHRERGPHCSWRSEARLSADIRSNPTEKVIRTHARILHDMGLIIVSDVRGVRLDGRNREIATRSHTYTIQVDKLVSLAGMIDEYRAALDAQIEALEEDKAQRHLM